MSAFDGSRSYWNVKTQCVAQVLKAVSNIVICVESCNFLLNTAIDHLMSTFLKLLPCMTYRRRR